MRSGKYFLHEPRPKLETLNQRSNESVDGRPFSRQGHPFFCLKAVLGGLGVILGLTSQEKNYAELGLKGSRESPFSPQTRGEKNPNISSHLSLCDKRSMQVRAQAQVQAQMLYLSVSIR